MKILVTGAAGMLADSMVPELRSNGYDVLATDININVGGCTFLDVRDYNQFLKIAESFKPDYIFHLAAETDLEKCQSNPDNAFRTNATGTHNAVLIAKKLKARLLYVSTAGVFDGEKKKPYTEFDTPIPINAYGQSKFVGENYVKDLLDEYFIVRAGWMMGGYQKDKKFIHKMLDQINSGAKQLYAVGDKFGTPTYAPAFSKTVVKLINTDFFGLYHGVCKNGASRYEVTAEMLKILGRQDISLNKVESSYFSNDYSTPRPTSEVLRNYALELRGMDEMPKWEDALKEYLTAEASNSSQNRY